MSNSQKRYVGLDVHKHYVMVGAVNAAQETVLPPRKVSLLEFEGWAKKYLRPTDEVVLEATTNAWCVHDLIEAAWTAVRYDQYWQDQFESLAYRIGPEKAIVAIARKLLVVIWHVLSAQVADRRAAPQQVARYFIHWGRQLRVKSTLGLKASEFARQQLDRLGIGQELEQVL
jgi:hypothetical protein